MQAHKSALPKAYLGLNTLLTWRNWYFGLSGHGAFGAYVYNYVKADQYLQQVYSDQGNFSNILPSTRDLGFNTQQLYTDYFLESGDFFRIDNMTLAYTCTKAEALGYVNEIRERAYMSGKYAKAGVRSDVSGDITENELTLDFILAERQRELASELVRRTDLIRFGKYAKGNNWDWKNGQRLGADVDDYRVLFPIPEAEMTNNPALKQNEGYK